MTRNQMLLSDIAVTILFAGLTAATLGVGSLNSVNIPTGGDTASHVLYAWQYAQTLLFSGAILPWMPEVFAGFPFLSYYFPFPFIVIAVLTKCIGFAPAFKWGGFAAALLLPGLVHVCGRRWFALPWPAAFLGALGAFAFLLHEQNSIWGGNLLSILSGEFAYSYGLSFALLACFAWARAADIPGGWVIAALLEAATGFSHGFTLLVVGFSTLALLTECDNLRRTIWMLVRGHLLAFCLLGGWLWPMLEMHAYTIPNDASFPLSSWNDLFPLALRPVFLAGLAMLPVAMLVRRVRSTITPPQLRVMRYLVAAAGLACLGFVAGDQIGLANIRFFPMAWLFGAIVCGWLVGLVIAGLIPCSGRGKSSSRIFFTLALTAGMLGWLTETVRIVPDWSLWNHAGLESKPQWHNLSKLFPAMKGSLWSPRLAFEHDPANNDLGSTRTLEALPMFLGGRPVLEGLYMESAIIGPSVYQLQSEISAQPSSPLARFPSGSLDPAFAAEHLRFLHADSLLLRSTAAKNAIEKSGLFHNVAVSPPFALYRLRDFSGALAEVVTQPIRNRPLKGWMDDSFGWFRIRSKFRAYLPVYGAKSELTASSTSPAVREKRLERQYMHFETDAVGKPHLVRMTWHPRWKLKSAGELYLAGTGFMLVVPHERNIILEYGHTAIGYAGMTATAMSVCILSFFWLRRKISTHQPFPLHGLSTHPQGAGSNRDGAGPIIKRVPFFLYLTAVTLSCVWFATQTPEKIYMRGHKVMQTGRNDEAAALFQRAFERRRPPAKKEEALFWLAKAKELAGQKEEAMIRYRELADNYHGYWVPESLYRYAQLGRDSGQRARVEPYAKRLFEEYPNNLWTGKLEVEKGGKSP